MSTGGSDLSKIHKEFRPGVELAMSQGWRLEIRSHAHLIPPPGSDSPRHLSIPMTPSDRRACKNFVASLRRRGVIVMQKCKKTRRSEHA